VLKVLGSLSQGPHTTRRNIVLRTRLNQSSCTARPLLACPVTGVLSSLHLCHIQQVHLALSFSTPPPITPSFPLESPLLHNTLLFAVESECTPYPLRQPSRPSHCPSKKSPSHSLTIWLDCQTSILYETTNVRYNSINRPLP